MSLLKAPAPNLHTAPGPAIPAAVTSAFASASSAAAAGRGTRAATVAASSTASMAGSAVSSIASVVASVVKHAAAARLESQPLGFSEGSMVDGLLLPSSPCSSALWRPSSVAVNGSAKWRSKAVVAAAGWSRPPAAAGSSEQEQRQQREQELRDFIRGGEDVADVMTQMATLLEDITGLEGREEAVAVEMAAAAAVAGRLEVLDRSFLLALDFMTKEAEKQNDTQQVWLLQVLKQQVLSQLESRFPPQVEVVALLVTTPQKSARLSILRRAVAAASSSPARPADADERSPGAVPADDSYDDNDDEEEDVKEDTRGGRGGGGTDSEIQKQMGQLRATQGGRRPHSASSASATSSGVPGGIDPGFVSPELVAAAAEEEEAAKEASDLSKPKPRPVPGVQLEHIIAQADDLIAFMEEDVPIRDRRLLARLVLAREEARDLMGGGHLDPRNDVRGLQSLPEAEVRFLSTLVGVRAPRLLQQRLREAMSGRQPRSEQVNGTSSSGGSSSNSSSSSGSRTSGPGAVETAEGNDQIADSIRPGHFLDSVTKVIGGMYKTSGSGVVVQQLERIRKEALDVLQEIGHVSH